MLFRDKTAEAAGSAAMPGRARLGYWALAFAVVVPAQVAWGSGEAMGEALLDFLEERIQGWEYPCTVAVSGRTLYRDSLVSVFEVTCTGDLRYQVISLFENDEIIIEPIDQRRGEDLAERLETLAR